MTQRLIYGKTITLKADDITFTNTNPITFGAATFTNATVTSLTTTTEVITSGGSLQLPSEQTQAGSTGILISGTTPNTGSIAYQTSSLTPTGARTDANSAQLSLRRIGQFVSLEFIPGLLFTVISNALAAAAITFTAVVPLAFRPATQRFWPIRVESNAVVQYGLLQVTTGGNIVITADATGANFTNAALCGVLGNVSVNYDITK